MIRGITVRITVITIRGITIRTTVEVAGAVIIITVPIITIRRGREYRGRCIAAVQVQPTHRPDTQRQPDRAPA